jgi:hypothetical protein
MTVLARASSNLPEVQSFFSCNVNSCYLVTGEQTEDFMCAAVAVIYRVCKSVRLLQLFEVMSYKHSINPIIGSNPVSSH